MSLSTSTTSAIHKVTLTATSPAAIERICAEELGVPLRVVGCPDGYYVSLNHTDAGRFSIDLLSGAGLSAELGPAGPDNEPAGSVLFLTGERGLIRLDAAGEVEQVGPGESVCVVRAAETSRIDWTGDEPRAHCVRLDLALVRDIAAATTGVTDVVFTGSRPVSRAAEVHWQETVAHVKRTLVGGPGLPVTPLVVGESARFLAAVALATFPNTTMESVRREQAAAAPVSDLPVTAETVRDAIAFIEEHAHDDLTVADIAAAAGVTPRAVQLAFRRHLDTTPMAYLRRVRLARVHDELAGAAAADGLTVTEVASKWGFSGSSRFTSYYREAYGEAPSQTLAS
ncbi:helix-turn-helix transcriptional regulator [Intrasporangium calvum]|uniref:Helix-turn-helix transcriptional regulator n=1 Tax=Intrasporangium calvum TaxID=53358 RepID=A0ABT5GGI1_9MICO|nr:AraC family transcriptional regulator [Intrasporangium calvum]MDC5697031.1 helix-turn-helix transcriptional regulator [Intrasporangium calvum]